MFYPSEFEDLFIENYGNSKLLLYLYNTKIEKEKFAFVQEMIKARYSSYNYPHLFVVQVTASKQMAT